MGCIGAIDASDLKRAVAAAKDSLAELGVASGDAVADGFVIWTRIAPDPFDPQALPPEALLVGWEVATDENMRKIVAQGQVWARPDMAHSVHVDVRGLEPQRTYFYRFHCEGVRAPDHEIAEAGFYPLAALPEGTTPATRARLAEVLDGAPVSPYW